MGGLNLQPWQYEAVVRMVEIERSSSGGVLADDVGLGKTYSAMGLMKRKYLPRTLVLCPAMLVRMWARRLSSCSFDVTKAPDFTGDVVVCSYNNNGFLAKLVKKPWGRIFVDEAQAIKNEQTKRSELVQAFVHSSAKRWALTATPIENCSEDLYELARFVGLDGHTLQDRIIVRTQEMVRIQHPRDFTVPRPLFEDVRVPLVHGSEIIKACHERVRAECSDELNCAVLVHCRMACLHPGLFDEAQETSSKVAYCATLLEQHEGKFVLFTHFTSAIDMIVAELERHSYICARLTGEMDAREKETNLLDFRNKEDFRVLVSNISVGGVGIDMVEARNVVIMEPQWNPFIEKQAYGRVVRPGQTMTVRVFRLIGVFSEHVPDRDAFRGVDTGNSVSIVGSGSATVDEAIMVKQLKKVCVCNQMFCTMFGTNGEYSRLIDKHLAPAKIKEAISHIVI